MILLALGLACVSDELESANPDCVGVSEVTWDGFAHGFFTTYCTSCHSVNNTDTRYGAPTDANFDSEADLIRKADRVRARVLVEATMPIGGGVHDTDLTLLDAYLTCTMGL